MALISVAVGAVAAKFFGKERNDSDDRPATAHTQRR